MLNPYLNNRPTQGLISDGIAFITNYQQPWLGKKLFCEWQTTQSLGRHSPGLASPISFHVEACLVSQGINTVHLKCKTYRKSLNYTTVFMYAAFYPSNNGNVSLIRSFDVLHRPLAI